MSDQPSREEMSDDLSTYSVDAEDQLQPEDTLEAGGDPLDSGYQTADRLQGTTAFGTTAEEQEQDETIEQRIHQEVPDPDSAYGAPENESGLDEPPMAGGDDVDAIPADQDFVGSGESVHELVSPDAGAESDTEATSVATEADRLADDTAEESAMHIVADEN